MADPAEPRGKSGTDRCPLCCLPRDRCQGHAMSVVWAALRKREAEVQQLAARCIELERELALSRVGTGRKCD